MMDEGDIPVTTDANKELLARINELQQKLTMAERAIDNKDKINIAM